jgi:glutamate--cysteine ligase
MKIIGKDICLPVQLQQKLQKLSASGACRSLINFQHGLEKESLRVDTNGHIAKTSHPQTLGSALTHPAITTDFSEALLEFVTPVFSNPSENLQYLHDLHSFTYAQMERDELLWISSMPCIVGTDKDIPLAQYGSSNSGLLKTLYREGLGYRYGRAMQTIAGIHFNFSLSYEFWQNYQELLGNTDSLTQFRTEQYFALIRNFKRYSWLLLYLYGASPALCKSFVRNRSSGLEEYDQHTLFAPYATSLRMGDLGYTSKAQQDLKISFNSLEEYSAGLLRGIHQEYSPYSTFIGEDGRPVQINSSVLQIENEFYSTIRPKRVSNSKLRPVQALLKEGVEYIEVRLVDLNPFLSLGIDEEQMQFLSVFLVTCLLRDSPDISSSERDVIENNFQLTVRRGRDPQLELNDQGKMRKLSEWAVELLANTQEVASLLTTLSGSKSYFDACVNAMSKVSNSELTPSARVLKRMSEEKCGYFRFAMNQSLASSDYFRASPLSSDRSVFFQKMSKSSLLKQKEIETADTLSFTDYLQSVNESYRQLI